MTEEQRIKAPLPYEVESLGTGVWKYPGGIHYLADHNLLPLEGPAGDWFTMAAHPGFIYRSVLCECGHSGIEGKEDEGEEILQHEIIPATIEEISPEATAGVGAVEIVGPSEGITDTSELGDLPPV